MGSKIRFIDFKSTQRSVYEPYTGSYIQGVLLEHSGHYFGSLHVVHHEHMSKTITTINNYNNSLSPTKVSGIADILTLCGQASEEKKRTNIISDSGF